MSSFFVEIVGEKAAAFKLQRMGQAAVRARPAMRQIAELLMATMRTVFEAQGRRGGGSWRKDSEGWMLRKMRTGLDPRINIASHALMDSMSVAGAPYQRLFIGDRRVVLGTDLPYADVTQRNRPFATLTAGDRLRMRAIVAEYLLMRFRTAKL